MLKQLYHDISWAKPFVVRFFTVRLPFFLSWTWPNALFDAMLNPHLDSLVQLVERVGRYAYLCVLLFGLQAASMILSSLFISIKPSVAGLLCRIMIYKFIDWKLFPTAASPPPLAEPEDEDDDGLSEASLEEVSKTKKQVMVREAVLSIATALASNVPRFIVQISVAVFAPLLQEHPLFSGLTTSSLISSVAYSFTFGILHFAIDYIIIYRMDQVIPSLVRSTLTELFRLTGAETILEFLSTEIRAQPDGIWMSDQGAAVRLVLRDGPLPQGTATYALGVAFWVALLKAVFFWHPISWLELTIMILWIAFNSIQNSDLSLWATTLIRFLVICATIVQLQNLGAPLLASASIAGIASLLLYSKLGYNVNFLSIQIFSCTVAYLLVHDHTLGGYLPSTLSVSKSSYRLSVF